MFRKLLRILLVASLLAAVGCAMMEKATPRKDVGPPFGDPGTIFLRDG